MQVQVACAHRKFSLPPLQHKDFWELNNASAAASQHNAAPSPIPAERELLMDGLGLERTIRTRHNAVAVFDNHRNGRSDAVMPGRPPIWSD